MNKIYKVVWNKSRQMYTVVCEFAKNNSGKAARTATVLAVLFGMGMLPQDAGAKDDYVRGDEESGQFYIKGTDRKQPWIVIKDTYKGNSFDDFAASDSGLTAIGRGQLRVNVQREKHADNKYYHAFQNSLTGEWFFNHGGYEVPKLSRRDYWGIFGQNEYDLDRESTALGYGAQYSNGSTVIGSRATNIMGYGVAIGNHAGAGMQSIAIGNRSQAQNNSVIIGYDISSEGTDNVAIGGNSKGFKSTGAGNTVIGVDAGGLGDQATAMGHNSVAANQATSIGNDTIAKGWGSIALGSDDVFEEGKADPRFSANLPKETIKKLYSDIFKDDKLKFTESEFMSKYGREDNKKFSPTFARATGAIAIGARTLAYESGSTALGTLAMSLGKSSTALGTLSYVHQGADGGIAVGEEARVFSANSLAVGKETEATNKGSMAYGYNTKAVGEGSVAIGYEVSANAELADEAKAKKIYNEANINEIKKPTQYKYENEVVLQTVKDIKKTKKKNDNAVVVGYKSVATGNRSVTLGAYSWSSGDDSVALGSYAYADKNNAFAFGSKAKATAESAMALGVGAKANLLNSIAIGVNSRTDYTNEDLQKEAWMPRGAITMVTSPRTGIVSVGSKGRERRITNVSAGYLDTDVATVAQLKALENKFGISIDDDNSDTTLRYISVDKTAEGGEAGDLIKMASKEETYRTYFKILSQEAEINVRKADGETYSQEFLNKLKETKAKAELKVNKAIEFEKKKNGGQSNLETTVHAKQNELKNIEKSGSTEDKLKKISEFRNEEARRKVLTDAEKQTLKEKNYYNNGATGADAIAIGFNAKGTATQSIAIGKHAKAEGKSGIAIGGISDDQKTSSAKTAAVAIGAGAQADEWSLALGSNTVAGNTAIAIGDRANATTKAIAIGQGATALAKDGSHADFSLAIGKAAKSKGYWNTLIGGEISSFEGNTNYDSVTIIGYKAKVNQSNAVAIGANSATKASTGNAFITNDAGNKWLASIGSNEHKRRLQGVADGALDDEAVTVKQLKGSNIQFEGQEGNLATAKTNNKVKFVEGEFSKTGANGNVVAGERYTADNVRVHTKNVGDETHIVVGMKTTPKFENVTIGSATNNVKLSADNSGNLNVGGKKITGLANGTESTDVATVGQLNSEIAKIQALSIKFKGQEGTEINADKNNGVVFADGEFNGKDNVRYKSGNIKVYTKTADNGEKQVIVGIKETPEFKGITLTNENNNKLSLTVSNNGNLDVGGKKIENVANGTADNDAVNMSQLKTKADLSKVNEIKTDLDGKIKGKADTTTVTNLQTTLTNQINNKADKNLGNIDESGKKVIRDLAKGSVKVVQGTNTTVVEGTEGNVKTYKVNVSDESIKKAVKPELDNKADKTDLKNKADKSELAEYAKKDATNLEQNDITKWQETLGTGAVSESDKRLVNGDTVYKALKPINESITKHEKDISKNQTDITNLKTEVDGNKNSIVNLTNNLDKKADKSELNLKADKGELANYALKNASNLDHNEARMWGEKLGFGEVAEGNTALVTGGKVFENIMN